MLTVGVVTFPPGMTVKPLEVIGVRSVLVTTDSVFPPCRAVGQAAQGDPQVVARAHHRGRENVQRVTSLIGRGQPPTSAAVVTLRTVPPCHSAVPVPAGSVTLIELPASPDSPPVADTRKSIT